MQGDNNVQLVVLCAEKPTSAVLKRVVSELPAQLKKIADDAKYTVTMAPVDGAVIVSDGSINVKVSLTSPLLREPTAGKLERFQYQRILILLFQIKWTNNEKFFDFELPVSYSCSNLIYLHSFKLMKIFSHSLTIFHIYFFKKIYEFGR